jgi:phage terminase small subunit
MAEKRKPTKPKTVAYRRPVPVERKKAGTSKEATAERKARFVNAYIANGGNATEAAKTAGYSHKTAGSQGQRLLKDVEIASQIAERAREIADKYRLTPELAARSIVQELSFDPAKLYNEDGSLKPITDLDEDTRMALVGIEFEQLGSPTAPVFVRKVKWASRASARDALMKHLGMFEADNKQKHPFQELDAAALDRLIDRKAKEAGVTLH